VLNLAVKARDAMPTGGKLTLETGNVVLDEAYAQQHSEVRAGYYVMIAMTDDGTGIPVEIRDRIFEPFFSTKEVGSLGYKTIAAVNAADALALVDAGAKFDLLFTDVIMSGPMNGRQLAVEMAGRASGLKVLYTSGYTENAIVHHGRLDPGVQLLAKPYRKSDLARAIRQALANGGSAPAAVSAAAV